MKIEKINYKIGCDMPECGRLSTYSLTFCEANTRFHVCSECAENLAKELKRVGVKA